MKTFPDFAMALPAEAFLFGKSVIWALLVFLACLYLRREIRSLLAELVKLVARVSKVNYEPVLKDYAPGGCPTTATAGPLRTTPIPPT